MDKRDIDEANDILDFKYREMTWKDWALVAAANIAVFAVLSALLS